MVLNVFIYLMHYDKLIKIKIIQIKRLYSLDLMNYYLLPVDKDESDKLEDALKKINYDVDVRSFYLGSRSY